VPCLLISSDVDNLFFGQNKHNISKKIVEDALFESQATIQDLERRLLDVAKSNITAVRRMKMVQNKSGFLKIHERIKGHSSQLVNLVQIAHTFVPTSSSNVKSADLESVEKHSLRL